MSDRVELDAYAEVMGQSEIEEIRTIAARLQGFRVQHVNSTRVGGGVAEILNRTVPLLSELGLDVRWDVMRGDPAFFEATKLIHNALHGSQVRFPPGIVHTMRDATQKNADLPWPEADITVIHDPQPVGLVQFRAGGKWIWRCHIDLSEADIRVWSFLRMMVERYDCSVFHLPRYTKELMIPQYILPPSIDPLSPKNEEIDSGTARQLVADLGVDPDLPIVLQVSRFDRLKDPVGVIEAFRLASGPEPAQLVLAGGGADDDPEGAAVLEEVRDAASRVPHVHILALPPDRHRDINALQRVAQVVVQKSVREGFGLVVTEAMWKGKPVIGNAVGGIREQIIHGITGFLVHSTEGTAFRIRQLLGDPDLCRRMGEQARESVRVNYLLPTILKRWLVMFLAVRRDLRGVVSLDD